MRIRDSDAPAARDQLGPIGLGELRRVRNAGIDVARLHRRIRARQQLEQRAHEVSEAGEGHGYSVVAGDSSSEIRGAMLVVSNAARLIGS